MSALDHTHTHTTLDLCLLRVDDDYNEKAKQGKKGVSLCYQFISTFDNFERNDNTQIWNERLKK